MEATGDIGTCIVSAEELRVHLGSPTWNSAKAANAQGILNGLQSELEEYLNRPLTQVHTREVAMTDAGGYLNLKYTPVTRVLNITQVDENFDPALIASVTVPALQSDTGVERTYDGTLNPVGDPLIVPGGLYYGIPNSFYVIEYVAGYVGDLSGVRSDMLRIASREFVMNNDDTINFRQDNAAEAKQSDNNPVKGWTPDELRKHDRKRRRVIA